MLDPHGALIYTMVIVTGAESSLPADEVTIIGDIVGHWPVFRGFDRKKLAGHLNACAELLSREDGLEGTLEAIKAGRPSLLVVAHSSEAAVPAFLRDDATPASAADLAGAFAMTGFFLDRHAFAPRGLAMPESRAHFVAAIARVFAAAESRSA